MRLIIDGDACPKIQEMEKLACYYNVPCTVYSDYNHHFSLTYAKVITVDQGYQSVDMKLSIDVRPGDLVITNDYGLMIMVIARGASSMDAFGNLYTEAQISELMMKKESIFYKKKNNIRMKQISKRKKEDDEKLFTALEQFIKLHR